MPISPLPILAYYDVQRFKQFSPQDAANWTVIEAPTGKKKNALYPQMGRKHIRFNNSNRLIFNREPRGEFRTLSYMYYVVGDVIYRVDKDYSRIIISEGKVETLNSNVFFASLVVGTLTFACFVDGRKIYIYQEPVVGPDGTITPPIGDPFQVVTDANAPKNPTYIAAFGNRIVVSSYKSSEFRLSVINLNGAFFDPLTCFTVAGSAVFAQAPGEIKQFGVLFNTLYIFTDFATSIWSNIPSTFQSSSGTPAVSFPWKVSSSYNWDYGLADPLSLDIDFDRMIWLGQNQNGLVQIMASDGGKPQEISTKAINLLFQKNVETGEASPFLKGNSNGFLYQFENTIYYRLSGGIYDPDEEVLDKLDNNNSVEFNFDTNTWARCIEANGERNRIQKHMFFNNTHYVTVLNESTVYEMSGQFYVNELRNPDQPNSQLDDAYIAYPFRYELVTQLIFQEDYSEFITNYVQIDFVFGNNTSVNTLTPFKNAVYIVDELVDGDGQPIFLVDDNDEEKFIIKEGSNYPVLDSDHYNSLYKPHVSLYYSDDGGENFNYADNLEFSQVGQYQWRMRWYQLGPSRNRCYKMVAVSPFPIVVLGGIMEIIRSSGGAN